MPGPRLNPRILCHRVSNIRSNTSKDIFTCILLLLLSRLIRSDIRCVGRGRSLTEVAQAFAVVGLVVRWCFCCNSCREKKTHPLNFEAAVPGASDIWGLALLITLQITHAGTEEAMRLEPPLLLPARASPPFERRKRHLQPSIATQHTHLYMLTWFKYHARHQQPTARTNFADWVATASSNPKPHASPMPHVHPSHLPRLPISPRRRLTNPATSLPARRGARRVGDGGVLGLSATPW